MFIRTLLSLRAVSILAAGYFIYQSVVFFYYALRDFLKGENGITRGLMLLSGGLIGAGSLVVFEMAYRSFVQSVRRMDIVFVIWRIIVVTCIALGLREIKHTLGGRKDA